MRSYILHVTSPSEIVGSSSEVTSFMIFLAYARDLFMLIMKIDVIEVDGEVAPWICSSKMV